MTVPTTIIHGTADENASHTALRIPNARLVTLHGAGHLCWIEDAPVVNDLIANAVTAGEPAP